MNRFVYKHCYQDGKIVSLPIFDDKLMDEIKCWQVQMLTLCTSSVKRAFPYVLPDPMMELLCIYMREKFVIMPSTIHHDVRSHRLHGGLSSDTS